MPAIDLSKRPAIELGDLRLEPSTLTAHGRMARATLEPRVMQVLVALTDSAGTVMSREALMDACWSGAVVGDDALHRAVAGARRALREAGTARLVIDTIPRVGYRLVSTPESEPADHDAAPIPPRSAPGWPAGRGRRRRRGWCMATLSSRCPAPT